MDLRLRYFSIFYLVPAVDCQLTPWSTWSGCSLSCGEGFRSRNRRISVAPAHGGKPCNTTRETSTCNLRKCGKPNIYYLGENMVA